VSADTGSRMPPGRKRNLVNTYVWTAAGGFFAETQDLMDSRAESTGGSFSFSASVGGSVTTDFDLFGASFDLDVSAKLGAHLELEVSKCVDTDTDFGVAVAVSPETDITHPDGTGRHLPQPGKVDAYQFVTFYMARPGTTTTCSSSRSSTRSGWSRARTRRRPPCGRPASPRSSPRAGACCTG